MNMKTHRKLTVRSLCLLLAVAAGALFTACDETIVIETVALDEQPFVTALELQGFLRDAGTAQTAIPVEVRTDTDIQVYLGLTKATDAATSARVAVDASLVGAYNEANGTEYEAFPAAQASVGGGGALAVAKWQKASEPLTITLAKGALEEDATYLLPVTVTASDVAIPETEKTLYYLVTVPTPTPIPPDITKGDVKTLVYIEVGNHNPLNAGNYLLETSGKPFFDYVVIFAANINYNATSGEVYLKYNTDVAHLLNNRDKYIKPLQDKGIKVLLGLLGNHDFCGLANLQGESLRSFAAQCKAAGDKYELDGVDFDDEWSSYNAGGVEQEGFFASKWATDWLPSGAKMARLIIETRRLMPDKTITVYEYGNGRSVGGTVDGVTMTDIIDYSMYAMYASGSSFNSTYIGMPSSKYSPKACRLTDGVSDAVTSTSTMTTIGNNIKNNGYGLLFFYDLEGRDYTTLLSAASNAMYGEPVVMEQAPYAKDWE
jgi:hypothetical protein